jgi:hypothetical protein
MAKANRVEPISRRELIRLEIQQRCVNTQVDLGMEDWSIRANLQFSVETMLDVLRLDHKFAAKVLQDRRAWRLGPKGRWDNFLVAIGLGRFAKYDTLYFTEMLTFPDVKFKEYFKIGAPVLTQAEVR